MLVEGGGSLLDALFDEQLVDRVAFFFAPKVIAGKATVAKAVPVIGEWRRVGRGEIVYEGRVR